MMMMMATTNRFRQILDAGKLPALRGVRKVGGELIELGRRGRIAVRLGSLGGALQVRSDLLSDLLVFGWIRLLKLLELAQDLREGRKLGCVPAAGGRCIDAACSGAGFVGCRACALDGAGENRL